jgi:hypothetical protein
LRPLHPFLDPAGGFRLLPFGAAFLLPLARSHEPGARLPLGCPSFLLCANPGDEESATTNMVAIVAASTRFIILDPPA